MRTRHLQSLFLGVAAAAGLLAVSRPSDAGLKFSPDSAWCGKISNGNTTCAFNYSDTRNDSTSDWASLGSSIGNGTYGWNNGTYGWFVASIGGVYYSCTATGNILGQWPLVVSTKQWVQVDFDPSGNCIHVQANRNTADGAY